MVSCLVVHRFDEDSRHLSPRAIMISAVVLFTLSLVTMFVGRSDWLFVLPANFALGGAAALCLFAAAVMFRDELHVRRSAAAQQKSLCVSCGYNISHSAERCPECGMLIWRPHTITAPPAKLETPDDLGD